MRATRTFRRLPLTLDDLTKAITAANTLQSVGRLEDHDLLYLLMANNPLQSWRMYRTWWCAAVRTVSCACATWRRQNGAEPQLFYVTANSKQAVTVLVYQQPGSGMVAVAHGAQRR